MCEPKCVGSLQGMVNKQVHHFAYFSKYAKVTLTSHVHWNAAQISTDNLYHHYFDIFCFTHVMSLPQDVSGFSTSVTPQGQSVSQSVMFSGETNDPGSNPLVVLTWQQFNNSCGINVVSKCLQAARTLNITASGYIQFNNWWLTVTGTPLVPISRNDNHQSCFFPSMNCKRDATTRQEPGILFHMPKCTGVANCPATNWGNLLLSYLLRNTKCPRLCGTGDRLCELLFQRSLLRKQHTDRKHRLNKWHYSHSLRVIETVKNCKLYRIFGGWSIFQISRHYT